MASLLRGPWSREYRALSAGITSLVVVFAFEGIGAGTVMPLVARDFGALGDYSITFTSFSLASLMGMVAAGQWADRVGLGRTVALTMVLFAVGSWISGFAPDLSWFVVGRVVQGIGIGMDLVTMYIIIGRTYAEEVRAAAISILSAAWVVPGLLGPALAGFIAEHSSWRVVFNVTPLALIGPAVFLIPKLRGLRETDAEHRHPALTQFLAAAAAVLGLTAVQAGTNGLGSWQIFAALGCTLAGMVVVAMTTRWLMPVGYLRLHRGVASVVALRGIIAGAFFGAEAYLPLALQHERGVGVAQSGAVLASGTLLWFVGATFVGSGRFNPTATLRFGTSCTFVALALLPVTVFVPSVTAIALWASVATWGLAALGMGSCYPTLAALLFKLSAESEHAAHSSAIQMSESIGVVVTLAFTGGMLTYADHTTGIAPNTFVWIWATCAAVCAIAVASVRRTAV